jgi:hypothetical protein
MEARAATLIGLPASRTIGRGAVQEVPIAPARLTVGVARTARTCMPTAGGTMLAATSLPGTSAASCDGLHLMR